MSFEAELLGHVKKTTLTDKEAIDKLATLDARLSAVQTQRTRLETKIESAGKEYARLSAEAKSKFDTDNLLALETKLLSMREENTRLLSEAEVALTAYEAAIAEIAKKVG
jgi:hypothetical protein